MAPCLYRMTFPILAPFLFFFQAEDGIRDVAVTGVQTCALPICGERELRDVELAEPGHAIEHLLRGERHDVELDAVGLDLARPDRAGPVVVAARQREVESRHARYREAAGTASTTADFLPL